jgi:hypothetical protein
MGHLRSIEKLKIKDLFDIIFVKNKNKKKKRKQRETYQGTKRGVVSLKRKPN